jgi:hypothetical protein
MNWPRLLTSVFAERMAGHVIGPHAGFLAKHAESRHGMREDRGLGDVGELQVAFRAFEAELTQVEAEAVVRLLEGMFRRGEIFHEGFTHAHALRALAREEKDLFHAPLPFPWRLSRR